MSHIDPVLLQTLVAVADSGSFTSAGRVLGVGQSTISQQIKRLEAAAGRQLLHRTTHRVAVTPEGEVMLEHARRVLDAHERLRGHLTATALHGRLRFGACEDFVLSALPNVLAAFARRYPEVDVELRVALSEPLYEAFDAGDLDIILVKQRSNDPRGVTAWREPVAWVANPELVLDPGRPLPLLLYPPPSVTRRIALAALEVAGIPWRVAFTSGSLTGLSAAARAGLGLMSHSGRLVPPGLAVIPAGNGLPALPEMSFVILGPSGHNPVTEALARAILQWSAPGSMGAPH